MERIWKDLYAAARAVLNPRRVSKMMEAESGKIYVGVCVDTACTLGVCAERNAIFNMITNGESGLRRVLAINSKGKALPPCGACRELMPQDYRGVEVMLDYEKERIVTLGELTPEWWL